MKEGRQACSSKVVRGRRLPLVCSNKLFAALKQEQLLLHQLIIRPTPAP